MIDIGGGAIRPERLEPTLVWTSKGSEGSN